MEKEELIKFVKLNKANWPKMLKTRYPDLYEKIFNSPGNSTSEKFFNFINGNIEIKKCYCGKYCKFYKSLDGYAKHCSNKCLSNDKNYKEKRKKNCLEKYGVEHPFMVSEFREKSKQTWLEKYGVEHPPSSKVIKDKIKSTCLEKYGVDNNFKNQKFLEKRKQTWLEKYGVDNPIKDKNIQEKRKQTLIENGFMFENGKQTEKIMSKQRKTNVESGRWFDYENNKLLLQEYQKYAKRVRYITNKNARQLPGIENRSIKIHIDHIFSIKDGFLLDISPEIVGHICNLRLLDFHSNISKNSKSDISINELFEKISKFEKDQI